MPDSKRSGAPERVSIIGLGRFGRSLAKTLHELGYEVTAIDLAALSAPVRNSSGTVVGAISIAAPTSRVSAERIPQLAQLLMEAADAASAALGYRAGALDLAAD